MTIQLQAAKSSNANASAYRRPVAALVDDWIAQRNACDQLVSRWQALEHKLSLLAKAKGLSFERVNQQSSPEIRAMNDLMRRIKAFDRRLPKFAEVIMQKTSQSKRDAMAKLRLGLAMRCCSPDDDHAWAMIAQAYEDLHKVDEPGRPEAGRSKGS